MKTPATKPLCGNLAARNLGQQEHARNYAEIIPRGFDPFSCCRESSTGGSPVNAAGVYSTSIFVPLAAQAAAPPTLNQSIIRLRSYRRNGLCIPALVDLNAPVRPGPSHARARESPDVKPVSQPGPARTPCSGQPIRCLGDRFTYVERDWPRHC
jgi:hypothetical protein